MNCRVKHLAALCLHTSSRAMNPANRHRAGFTLIELSIVLLLIAVTATITMVSLGSFASQSRMEDVLSSIESFDHLSRQQALRSERSTQIVIDLDEQTIRQAGSNRVGASGSSLRIPSGFRLVSVRLLELDDLKQGDRDRVGDGQFTLACSPLGYTASYAVSVRRENGNGVATSTSVWIVFAGLTGHSQRITNEEQLNALVESIQPGIAAAR